MMNSTRKEQKAIGIGQQQHLHLYEITLFYTRILKRLLDLKYKTAVMFLKYRYLKCEMQLVTVLYGSKYQFETDYVPVWNRLCKRDQTTSKSSRISERRNVINQSRIWPQDREMNTLVLRKGARISKMYSEFFVKIPDTDTLT